MTGIPYGTDDGISLPEHVWQALIAASSGAALLVTIYCLSQGITTIFMHLFYFPIILVAYHYRYRGFLLAMILAIAYVWLVYFFMGGEFDVVIGAWLRFFIFAGIAAVVASLSEHLSEDRIALQKSERKYRSLFNNMLEGLAYCRMVYSATGEPLDWVYLDVNTAFERLTGLSGIRGKRVMEVLPDIRRFHPGLFETYGRVASTGLPESFEIDFIPLKMWMRVSVFSPEKGFFVAVFENVSERHRAEEALKESEKRYRDLFEINNAVMLIIDPKSGSIVDANNAACRYYGYTRQELNGLPITEINTADADTVRREMGRAESSSGAVFRFRHRKKTGEIRAVQVFSAPIVLGDRRLLHSIIQDVNDLERSEDALRQANRKLNLLSSITRHDINNQLFSILAHIELSKENHGDPSQTSEHLLKIERAARAIERQIAFTKEYEDLGVTAPVWQPVASCVSQAITLLPMRDVNVDLRVSDLEVYADPLFERVFYNLIDNALRYGGPDMTRIRISKLESGTGMVIVVEDDGTGIAAEDKERLFTRGFGKHTGLGLFLSREILAITGITIAENGEPGKGARFEIVVPKGGWRYKRQA